MNRKGKKGGGMMALVIILVLIVAVGGLYMFGIIPNSAVGGGDNTPGVGSCDSLITPDITFKAYDVENPGTALTEIGRAHV